MQCAQSLQQNYKILENKKHTSHTTACMPIGNLLKGPKIYCLRIIEPANT